MLSDNTISTNETNRTRRRTAVLVLSGREARIGGVWVGLVDCLPVLLKTRATNKESVLDSYFPRL